VRKEGSVTERRNHRIIVTARGGPEVLRLVEEPLPEPGVGAPIDYFTEDFVERIRRLTGGGVDVVFDTVRGARQLWRSYRAVRRGGRLVPIGSAGITAGGMKVIPLGLLTVMALKLIPDGRRVPLSPNMVDYPKAHPDWYRNTLTELLGLAASGTVEPIIDARIPLAEAARAHELLHHGRHAGKVGLMTGSTSEDSESASWT
jgi:NADPH2:quinone reductase